jgi:hypothetical protein
MRVEEIITDRIVKLLEAGTVPWHKPWVNRGADALPRNAITKREYRGINVFILASVLRLTVLANVPRGGTFGRGRAQRRARHADYLLEVVKPRG